MQLISPSRGREGRCPLSRRRPSAVDQEKYQSCSKKLSKWAMFSLLWISSLGNYIYDVLASVATVTSIELAPDLPFLLVSRCPIQLYNLKKDGSEVGHRQGRDGRNHCDCWPRIKRWSDLKRSRIEFIFEASSVSPRLRFPILWTSNCQTQWGAAAKKANESGGRLIRFLCRLKLEWIVQSADRSRARWVPVSPSPPQPPVYPSCHFCTSGAVSRKEGGSRLAGAE